MPFSKPTFCIGRCAPLSTSWKSLCRGHAFRRFRVTHLRESRVPEHLIRFWVGQAAQSVTDLYSRVADDLPFRLSVVENVGVGFDLPDSLIPVIPSAGEENAEASEPQEVAVAGD
jgi:hypothetical protein